MVGLGFAVARSARRPGLIMDIVGMPSDHTMKARWGISKDVPYDGSHAVVVVGLRGVLPTKGMMLSGGGRQDEGLGGKVAVSQIAEN
jgi:hypothetical protein